MRFYVHLLWIVFMFFSCNPYQRISGRYKLESKDVFMKVELNQDKTFVEYVSTDLCRGKYFFGFYEVRNRKVILSPLDATVNILTKKDALVYSYNPSINGTKIYIKLNENIIVDDATILINDSLYGVTDKDGVLSMDSMIVIRSIKINSFSFEPRHFKIDTAVNYNSVFIMIYDFGLVHSCADFYFLKKIQVVNSNKLRVVSKKESGSKAEFFMLRQ